MEKEVRVFIVDDSAVVRHTISELLNKSGNRIKIVGTAPNGNVALSKIAIPKYKPDIITMDIMMPEMDGFETIGHIMDRFPTPVIIVSALSQKEVDASLSNLGMAAFESGAVEFVKKPKSIDSLDKNRFKRELIDKILHLSQIDLARSISSFDFKSFLEEDAIEETPVSDEPLSIVKKFHETLIVIGASTGGPRAISLILSKIPSQFSPIVIIQHMPEEMVEQWVERLRNLYPHLHISIPTDREFIMPNRVYVAPGGKHCAIKEAKRFRIYKGEKVNFLMPAIDVTLISAIQVYKANVIGIILTGMGKDGYEGAKKIKRAGGKIIAEHESTCVIYGMPKAVIEGNLVNYVVPLHKIPTVLSKYC